MLPTHPHFLMRRGINYFRATTFWLDLSAIEDKFTESSFHQSHLMRHNGTKCLH